VMKLGQAQGHMLKWRRCRIDIKGAPMWQPHPR
jgi:hypothetical protein